MRTKTEKPSMGRRLISSMEAGLEVLRAGRDLPATWVAVPPDPPPFCREQLQTLRRRSRMSQSGFAKVLNVSVKAVESWEQGVRRPSGAALRLLQFLETPSLFLSMIDGGDALPPRSTKPGEA